LTLYFERQNDEGRFFEKKLFDIQNNAYFLHKITFMKIFTRNGSFASFEFTFEFPPKNFIINFP